MKTNRLQLDLAATEEIIENALCEDIGVGDITTNCLFPENHRCSAAIIAKQKGVIAGLPVAERVFRKLDKDIIWSQKKSDGETVEPNQTLAQVSGLTRAILSGERLALNFLQRLSGIATLTARFVSAVEGLPVKILDTRKTSPGIRVFDKYAVRAGGGYNHRTGLYDGVLIKDNHIKLAGGILSATGLVRKRLSENLKIEVETSTLEEVQEALQARADIIMLDNMSADTIKKAIELINGMALVEASGGVGLQNVREIAEKGVDFISIGSLTHSPPALDIGLYMV